jgi:NLI interacting factor-like phosphatase
MQSIKNPFQNKGKYIIHTQSCKCYSREYINYKQIQEEAPILDYEAIHVQVQHQSQSDGAMGIHERAQLLINKDTEDMMMEIHLSTCLSKETEDELQSISKFNRITTNEIYMHHVILPCQKHKITLFLDLDETLIFSKGSPFSKESNSSSACLAKFYNSKLETSCLFHFAMRPFLKEFMQSVAANYDLVVMTLIRFSRLLKKITPMLLSTK